MKYLWNAPEDVTKFDSLTLGELLLIQTASLQMHQDIRRQIRKKMRKGKWQLSKDRFSCDGFQFEPKKYYRGKPYDSEFLKNCAHFHTIVVMDDNINSPELQLCGDCIFASAKKLRHLTVHYRPGYYIDYSTSFNLLKYEFKSLLTLNLSGYKDDLNIDKICSSKVLNFLSLNDCNMDQFQYIIPPKMLEVNAKTKDTTGLISKLAETMVPNLKMVNPPTTFSVLDNIASCEVMTIEFGSHYFHFQLNPFTLAANDLNLINLLLAKLADFYATNVMDHLHIDIRSDEESGIILIGILLKEETVDHLTVITSKEGNYVRCLQEYLIKEARTDADIMDIDLAENEVGGKPQRIREFILTGDDHQPKQFVYIDFDEKFAHATSNHYELITPMELTSLSLKTTENMTDVQQNDLMTKLNQHKLNFLKITTELPAFNGFSLSNDFSIFTHFRNSQIEVLSKTRKNIKHVEIIFNLARHLDENVEPVLGEIPTGGEFYHINFKMFMSDDNFTKFAPSFVKIENCKYMSVTGHTSAFSRYVHDNWRMLQGLFKGWQQLIYLKVEVDERAVDEEVIQLLSPALIFPSLKYLVLVFLPHTKVVDRNVEELLQQHNQISTVKWIQLKQTVQQRFKRIYILVRLNEHDKSMEDDDELKEFVENTRSLLAESNEEIASKKNNYDLIQSISHISY